MNKLDLQLLKENGWIVECESPFEIRLENDPESFAQGCAATMILEILKENKEPHFVGVNWTN